MIFVIAVIRPYLVELKICYDLLKTIHMLLNLFMFAIWMEIKRKFKIAINSGPWEKYKYIMAVLASWYYNLAKPYLTQPFLTILASPAVTLSGFPYPSPAGANITPAPNLDTFLNLAASFFRNFQKLGKNKSGPLKFSCAHLTT